MEIWVLFVCVFNYTANSLIYPLLISLISPFLSTFRTKEERTYIESLLSGCVCRPVPKV